MNSPLPGGGSSRDGQRWTRTPRCACRVGVGQLVAPSLLAVGSNGVVVAVAIEYTVVARVDPINSFRKRATMHCPVLESELAFPALSTTTQPCSFYDITTVTT